MANEVDTTLLDNLNSIKNSKADIKQALIDKGQNPTNVFADYAQLIGDIQTGEDLTEVLNTQDQKIAELEATLENKTAGENAKLNIFVQTTEPTSKDGIWIQVDKTLEHIVEDDDYYIEGEYDVDGKYRNIPYNFYCGSAVAIGTDIYLFGSYESTYQKTAYKYNTLTDTYTQLADIPYNFYYSSAASVGTDIYLFGSYESTYQKTAYKYNTLTNTYTQLANIPYNFYFSSVVAIDTDVYLFGGGGNANYVYKYNTLTNTYTQLANIPSFKSGGIVAIGTDIYLFGGNGPSSYQKTAYKYNTLTNTYIQLTNTPHYFTSGGIVAIGTDVYLFGGNGNGTSLYQKTAYKYNTLTDTYTQLADIPYSFLGSVAVTVADKIFLLGGRSYPTKIQCYETATKTYENNTAVIVQGIYYSSSYLVKLLNVEGSLVSENQYLKYAFKKALFYDETDGLQDTLPVYYGNGTKWTQI